MKNNRTSKTQLGSTPTLHGKDAQDLLDSLKNKPTERSKENGRKLVKYFEGNEEQNKHIAESLKQALIEMKLIREGDLPKKTWIEVMEENKSVEVRVKMEDELVQYFVVNSELNMSTGKIAAQIAHVATNITLNENGTDSWDEWHENNQPKIILRGKEKDLLKLIDQSWYHIRDNGRTEIPENSLTVVGCVPNYKSELQKIVKRFQLL